ncbi:MAG: dTDP-4-dehydrorhamnose reductase [Steroidobacterales bacterium]
MKVLVLGGGGQVARAVVATAPARHAIVAKSRAELDISDRGAIADALAQSGVDWIINGAAYTAVDLAEDQVAGATLINDTAVGNLVNAAAAAHCRLVHVSTDFVFDGNSSRPYLPTDATNPLSVYGRTKLAGERRVLDGGDGIVLRTAWVYASAGRNFVLTMLRLMRERDQLRVVADQIGTPTWATGIARAIWALIDVNAPGGLYHWTDLGVASWYDFAVAIQEEALARGLLERAVPIMPIGTDQYPTRAVRPRFSVLDTAGTRALLPVPAHHWRQNLRLMLDEL